MYVDSGKAIGALLTDLPKAFHYLDHGLLISKLNAYGFSLSSLRLSMIICQVGKKEQILTVLIVNG